MCMELNLVKHPNPIVMMEISTQPNCCLCIYKNVIIPQNILDRHVTIMNNNLEIDGANLNKTDFNVFF